jgi:isopentenyl phosphate kinase
LPEPPAGDRPGPILIKLGGSLITDKRRRESVRSEVLERVAAELAEARRRWADGGLVLGHGSGSFGHFAAAGTPLAAPPAARAADPGGLRRAAARTQDAAARLHRAVVAALLGAGLEPYSLPPSGWLTTGGGEISGVHLEPLDGALRLGMLPVVYGDVATDREVGMSIVSTEGVLLAVARELAALGRRPQRAVWLGETDGVLDATGTRIGRVDGRTLESARRSTGGSAGVDVTGGMRLRLETAWELALAGVPSWIGDGRRPGVLTAALRGAAPGGTRIEWKGVEGEAAARE